MQIVFESHATTLDNEAGLASGWNDVELSDLGKKQAKELGARYDINDFDAIFCSDLQRSYKTAQLAFPGISSSKLFIDWRLRECDYGDFTQKAGQAIESQRAKRVAQPFPNGESYEQAMERMKSFVDDLRKYGKKFNKVMVIGSRATQYGLDCWVNGKNLEDLVNEPWQSQPGWHYDLEK